MPLVFLEFFLGRAFLDFSGGGILENGRRVGSGLLPLDDALLLVDHLYRAHGEITSTWEGWWNEGGRVGGEKAPNWIGDLNLSDETLLICTKGRRSSRSPMCFSNINASLISLP